MHSKETRKKISESLKGNLKLKQAIKDIHARRIASGDDARIREKIRKTRVARGDWTDHDKSEWIDYCKIVRNVTDSQPLHTLKNIEKRGRGKGKYHLDHIVSKKTGFDLGLPPWFIGNIINLRMIPESENCAKQDKSDEDDISSLWFSLTEVFEYA